MKPAAAFFRDDIEDARQHYDMYEFIQEAGDLVYVLQDAHSTAAARTLLRWSLLQVCSRLLRPWNSQPSNKHWHCI